MENCGRFVNYISFKFFYLSVYSHGRNKLTWGDMGKVAE